jgi:type IV pilus assembly protein PilV
MTHNPRCSSPRSQQGAVLLEGLVAVLIFSVGILGVVGLQASMVKATAEAKYRSEASFVVQKRLGAMWVDQQNLASYAESDTDISTSSGLPNGKRTTTRGEADCDGGDLSCFKVTVTWQHPGSADVHNVAAVARVTGG